MKLRSNKQTIGLSIRISDSATPSAMSKDGNEKQTPKPPDKMFSKKRSIFNAPLNDANSASTTNTPPKPTPIFAPFESNPTDADQNLCEIIKNHLSASLQKGTFICRLGQFGVQIKFDNEATFKQASTILQKHKILFYHHEEEPGRIKKSRFIIYGLGQADLNELKEDIEYYGLHPLDIKKMTIKTPRYPGHANYIVYFNQADKVTLHMVQSAEFLCSIRPKWAHFNPPEPRERQCDKCWRFGHRSYGCNLKARCMYCASEEHIGFDCPLLAEKNKLNKKEIPVKHLKCCNCGGNHTAIFKSCKGRSSTKKITKSPEPTTPAPLTTYTPAPTPTMNPWKRPMPQLSSRSLNEPIHTDLNTVSPSTKPVQDINDRSSRSRTRRTRSLTAVQHVKPTPDRPSSAQNIAPVTSSKIYNQHKRTVITNRPLQYSYNSNKNIHFTNDQLSASYSQPLLGPDEMSNIFQEMLNISTQCQSRADQLNALMRLAMNYLRCWI